MVDILEYFLSAEEVYDDYRKQVEQKFGLTAKETDVLIFLANNPEFDRAADVSRIRKITKSHVSLAVHSLCEKGLLTRKFFSGDKKNAHLFPTEKALPVIEFGRQKQREFSQTLFEGFSDEEKKEFFTLHDKIAENLRSAIKK